MVMLNGPTNFSDATIIGVIIVDELLSVPKHFSVHQLFSVASVLICEKTQLSHVRPGLHASIVNGNVNHSWDFSKIKTEKVHR